VAATDAEIFLAYRDHVLCPALPSGDVVVIDNLSSQLRFLAGGKEWKGCEQLLNSR
jgi:hypothetical protein